MIKGLTNLLPHTRRKALEKEYLLRLGVVILIFIVVLILAQAILLFPRYQYLSQNAELKQVALAQLKSTVASTDEASVQSRLEALANDAEVLQTLATTQSPSSLLRTILQVPHSHISLIGFAYKPAVGEAYATVTITGIANTRDVLQAYQSAFSAVPFVEKADIPVSAYAKDADINFSLTLTIQS